MKKNNLFIIATGLFFCSIATGGMLDSFRHEETQALQTGAHLKCLEQNGYQKFKEAVKLVIQSNPLSFTSIIPENKRGDAIKISAALPKEKGEQLQFISTLYYFLSAGEKFFSDRTQTKTFEEKHPSLDLMEIGKRFKSSRVTAGTILSITTGIETPKPISIDGIATQFDLNQTTNKNLYSFFSELETDMKASAKLLNIEINETKTSLNAKKNCWYSSRKFLIGGAATVSLLALCCYLVTKRCSIRNILFYMQKMPLSK